MKNKFENKDGSIKKGKDVEWFYEQQKINASRNPYTDEFGVLKDRRDEDKLRKFVDKLYERRMRDLKRLSPKGKAKIQRRMDQVHKRYLGEMGIFD
jgi:hypothetical protein